MRTALKQGLLRFVGWLSPYNTSSDENGEACEPLLARDQPPGTSRARSKGVIMSARTVISTAVGAVVLAGLFIGLSGHSKPHSPTQAPASAPVPVEPVAYQPKTISLIDTNMTGAPNVTAGGVQDAVPGAILCDNYDKTMMVYDAYTTHWQETLMDRQSGGRYTLIHGAPDPAPNPDDFGCVLVPAGTPMRFEMTRGVPVAAAHMVNGDVVTGVTLIPLMTFPKTTPPSVASNPSTSETPDDQGQSQQSS